MSVVTPSSHTIENSRTVVDISYVVRSFVLSVASSYIRPLDLIQLSTLAIQLVNCQTADIHKNADLLNDFKLTQFLHVT